MTAPSAVARFARAFVVTSYLVGEREAALASGLAADDTRRLREALASHDRAERARALALEISRMALALEQGGLR